MREIVFEAGLTFEVKSKPDSPKAGKHKTEDEGKKVNEVGGEFTMVQNNQELQRNC